MIDYHIHTMLCNHAGKPMEEYVNQAINIGLQEICFLDHLTMSKNGRDQSMSVRETGLYFQAIQRLKYRYRDRIKIRAGLEVDFNPKYAEQVKKVVRAFSFDVIGSAVHFIREKNIVSQRGRKPDQSDADFQELCLLYVEKMDRMMEHDYFDVVCHLDVMKKFGEPLPDRMDEKFDEILSKISYKNLTVELNTSGYDHPAADGYPSFDLLKRCRAKGIEITLASDAHHPESVGRHFDKALSDLSSSGYHRLAGFYRRQRYLISINSKGDNTKNASLQL
ncbi:MAG: histidinol-phosphatase [Deltaproteobacteria bacterium]|nr:histidinol-phosphatase [Deltaproteobacteria bacterium]